MGRGLHSQGTCPGGHGHLGISLGIPKLPLQSSLRAARQAEQAIGRAPGAAYSLAEAAVAQIVCGAAVGVLGAAVLAITDALHCKRGGAERRQAGPSGAQQAHNFEATERAVLPPKLAVHASCATRERRFAKLRSVLSGWPIPLPLNALWCTRPQRRQCRGARTSGGGCSRSSLPQWRTARRRVSMWLTCKTWRGCHGSEYKAWPLHAWELNACNRHCAPEAAGILANVGQAGRLRGQSTGCSTGPPMPHTATQAHPRLHW